MADSAAYPPEWKAFQEAWRKVGRITLCERQARKGIAVAVQDGECPIHGGDGCLYTYVQVKALREELYGLG